MDCFFGAVVKYQRISLKTSCDGSQDDIAIKEARVPTDDKSKVFFTLFLPRIYIYIKKKYHRAKEQEIPGREDQKKPVAYRPWPPLILRY